MSPAFRTGIETNFPGAEIPLDRYHVVQLLNQAMETLRREEQRSHPELKKTRYLWLKRPSRLTSHQRERLAEYRQRHRNLARAYELKLEFDEFWEQPIELAEPYRPTGASGSGMAAVSSSRSSPSPTPSSPTGTGC